MQWKHVDFVLDLIASQVIWTSCLEVWGLLFNSLERCQELAFWYYGIFGHNVFRINLAIVVTAKKLWGRFSNNGDNYKNLCLRMREEDYHEY